MARRTVAALLSSVDMEHAPFYVLLPYALWCFAPCMRVTLPTRPPHHLKSFKTRLRLRGETRAQVVPVYSGGRRTGPDLLEPRAGLHDQHDAQHQSAEQESYKGQEGERSPHGEKAGGSHQAETPQQLQHGTPQCEHPEPARQ